MKPETDGGYMPHLQLDGEGMLARHWRGPVNEGCVRAQPGDGKVCSSLGLHADHGGAGQVQVFRHAISVSSNFDQAERVRRAWDGSDSTRKDLLRCDSREWSDGIGSNVSAQHGKPPFEQTMREECSDGSKVEF
jgi:hypothetical protein